MAIWGSKFFRSAANLRKGAAPIADSDQASLASGNFAAASSGESRFARFLRGLLGIEVAVVGDSDSVKSGDRSSISPSSASAASRIEVQEADKKIKNVPSIIDSEQKAIAAWSAKKELRSAIWAVLIDAGQWRVLNDLINISAKENPSKTFYPFFSQEDRQAAFSNENFSQFAKEKLGADDKFPWAEPHIGKNNSLHLAISGVGADFEQEENREKVLAKLCKGAAQMEKANLIQIERMPIFEKNENGDSPLHLAAKTLEDFAPVKPLFETMRDDEVYRNEFFNHLDGDGMRIGEVIERFGQDKFKQGFAEVFAKDIKLAGLDGLQGESVVDEDGRRPDRGADRPSGSAQAPQSERLDGKQVLVVGGSKEITFVAAYGKGLGSDSADRGGAGGGGRSL